MTRALDDRRDGVPSESRKRVTVPSGMRCKGLRRYWSDELGAWQLARSRAHANELIAATLARRKAPVPSAEQVSRDRQARQKRAQTALNRRASRVCA